MSGANGARPPADPGILTSNDLKRCKVALGGRSPYELLTDPDEMFAVLILALALRSDPGATLEWAADQPLGDWFDMTGGSEPDPRTAAPGSPGPGAATSGGSGSRQKRASGAPAPSSASTST